MKGVPMVVFVVWIGVGGWIAAMILAQEDFQREMVKLIKDPRVSGVPYWIKLMASTIVTFGVVLMWPVFIRRWLK